MDLQTGRQSPPRRAGPLPAVDHTRLLQPARQHHGHGHHPAVQRLRPAERVPRGAGGRIAGRSLSSVHAGGGGPPGRGGSTSLHLPP